MRLAFISGGSTGHLAPLVAVADALKRLRPDADILFVCSNRPDDALYLQSEGVSPALLLPRPGRGLGSLATLAEGWTLSRSFLEEYDIDAVFGKGAAVSVPFCFAATRMGIPVVIHESDAVMGRANRLIARRATAVCLGWNRQRQATNRRFTGNPVRGALLGGSRAEGLRRTGLNDDKPVLLVTGGSQGAQALNEAITAQLSELLTHCHIMHLTGKGKREAIAARGYWSAEHAGNELADLYAAADMALIRGGSGSIMECAAYGLPAMIVPIRGLAHDHQYHNAKAAERTGGAVLLEQRSLSSTLSPMVRMLGEDAQRRARMGAALRSIYNEDASGRIAQIILESVAQEPPTQ